MVNRRSANRRPSSQTPAPTSAQGQDGFGRPRPCTNPSGYANSPRRSRIVSQDGRFNVLRLGQPSMFWRDPYHFMLGLPWPAFFGAIAMLYLVANSLFATAYLIGPDNIANARPGSFADAFFFSVQTMASIGYGAMYPQTTYAHLVVTIEALTGLMGLAMATGLMFARFSRPTARVMFSRVAVIAPFDNVPMLMFRSANQRRNRILEAQIRLTLIRDEVTHEGHCLRRFYDLNLVRSQTPMFALSWTVMHPLDETSPLYGMTMQQLDAVNTEIVVTLTGLDETLSQSIHARHSYTPAEILPDMRFVDTFSYAADGQFTIDYSCFHTVVPIKH